MKRSGRLVLRVLVLWLVPAMVLLMAAPGRGLATERAASGAALNWVRLPGAESCITAAELAQRVEARLERRVFVLTQHAELTFDGFVRTRAAGGFEAHLSVSNTRGQVLGARDIASPLADCRALDEALVLISALTLFPGDLGLSSGGIPLDEETSARLHALFGDEPSELDPAELSAPTYRPTEPSEETPAPPAPSANAAAPPPRADPQSAARASVEATSLVSLGTLPGVALGVGAVAALALPDVWPLRFGAAHFFTRDARAAGLPTGVGHFTRSELTLQACPVSSAEDFGFEFCAGAAVGLLRVTTDGFVERGIDATDPVLDLGAQWGLRLRLFGVVLARVAVVGLLPLVQHSYDFQALDASTRRLFRSAQVSGRLQIGLGAEF